ncbi:MAG TPA: 3-oxoacyl-[acyl-carrier-protein] synthase III C-terminal domain-containing protein [Smithellaceae bacterium]|nr:3-oxoacyl-[acyl-carrier-protein] synthase III C-terminal domain-containing protein [Smithellaceae bacterium]
MLYLHGMGHFNPEEVISNRFLEDLDIGTSNEWILDRVGIINRRTVLPLDYIRQTKNADYREAYAVRRYNNAQMAALAARLALDRAGLSLSDIGMIVAGSSSPDHIAPAESSSIAAELGIEVPCLDMNSACSSFGMQINFLSKMQPDTLPPYVLVVDSETLTKAVNYADRSMAVLFGDGSAAAVVSSTVRSRAAFRDCTFASRPSAWEKVGINHLWRFYQDGNAVQGFAIRTTTEGVKRFQEIAGAQAQRFIFIGHQANLSMLTTVCERTGILPEHHWFGVDQFGNTGCASAPSVLSAHWEDLQAGDCVALSIVGAGLSWAHILLKVEDEKNG